MIRSGGLPLPRQSESDNRRGANDRKERAMSEEMIKKEKAVEDVRIMASRMALLH